MRGSYNEEDIRTLLKGAWQPAVASDEFRQQLLERLRHEVSRQAAPSPRRHWFKVALAAIAIAALALIGYFVLFPVVSPPITMPTMGLLEIRVTDDPPQFEDISAIYVTVADIEVHRADDGEWIAIEITGSNTFDLIELKEGGLEHILASGSVTAGKYTQIRMTIEKVEVTIGDETQEAKLPSGKLKFVRPFEFEVIGGQTTVLTLDFDAEQFIEITGEGEIILHPVIPVVHIRYHPTTCHISRERDGLLCQALCCRWQSPSVPL
jgi:hypothetical protein